LRLDDSIVARRKAPAHAQSCSIWNEQIYLREDLLNELGLVAGRQRTGYGKATGSGRVNRRLGGGQQTGLKGEIEVERFTKQNFLIAVRVKNEQRRAPKSAALLK
jgi:hypothetical protein